MESNAPDPSTAAATLSELDAARASLVRDVRLPRGYHLAMGLAIAVQVGTVAWGLAADTTASTVALLAGCLGLAAVTAWQVARFRAVNGMWVSGFVHRAALGASVLGSTCYALGLGGSVWAAYEGAWWAVLLVAALTGIGYAAAGEWWLRRYRAHPESDAVGWTWQVTVVVVLGGAVALLLLVLGR